MPESEGRAHNFSTFCQSPNLRARSRGLQFIPIRSLLSIGSWNAWYLLSYIHNNWPTRTPCEHPNLTANSRGLELTNIMTTYLTHTHTHTHIYYLYSKSRTTTNTNIITNTFATQPPPISDIQILKHRLRRRFKVFAIVIFLSITRTSTNIDLRQGIMEPSLFHYAI